MGETVSLARVAGNYQLMQGFASLFEGQVRAIVGQSDENTYLVYTALSDTCTERIKELSESDRVLVITGYQVCEMTFYQDPIDAMEVLGYIIDTTLWDQLVETLGQRSLDD